MTNLKQKILMLIMALILITNLIAEENDDFSPGIVNVCFSADLVGNTIGSFSISIDPKSGTVVTPFTWFNKLAKQYGITRLTRKHRVQDTTWHSNGRYPMNIFELELQNPQNTV